MTKMHDRQMNEATERTSKERKVTRHTPQDVHAREVNQLQSS